MKNLVAWSLVGVQIALVIVAHEIIAFLRPYYTASQPWATKFWQEHLTVWEYRLIAIIVVCVLLVYTILRGRSIGSNRTKGH